MKCHCQDHLDLDHILSGIARPKFKEVIFGNSNGTEGNTDKFVSYYTDLHFFLL